MQNAPNHRDFREGETPGEYVTRRFNEIVGLISASHSRLHGEEKEEAISASLAIFWQNFSKLADDGRDVTRLLHSIIKYAARTVRSGRGINGGNSRDVMSVRCKVKNGIKKLALPQTDREAANPAGLDALRDDSSPADLAALNIDYEVWLDTLDMYPMHVMELARVGESQTDIAEIFGVSRTRIFQLREQARASYEKRFG